jgi:hypothetical protein
MTSPIALNFHSSSPLTLLPHVSKLNKVQTNDIAPTTLGLSPTPIMYPHSTKHDEVQGKLYTCIADAIKECKEMWPLYSLSPHHRDNVAACIISDHGDCWRHHSGGRKISFQYIECLSTCLYHLLNQLFSKLITSYTKWKPCCSLFLRILTNIPANITKEDLSTFIYFVVINRRFSMYYLFSSFTKCWNIVSST